MASSSISNYPALRSLGRIVDNTEQILDMKQQLHDRSNPAWSTAENVQQSVLNKLRAAAAEAPQLLAAAALVPMYQAVLGACLAELTKLPEPVLLKMQPEQQRHLLELHTHLQRTKTAQYLMPILFMAAHKGAGQLAATAADMRHFFKLEATCDSATRSAVLLLLQDLKWLLRFDASSTIGQQYLRMCSSLLAAPTLQYLQMRMSSVRRHLLLLQQRYAAATAAARVCQQAVFPSTEAAAAAAEAAIQRYEASAAARHPSGASTAAAPLQDNPSSSSSSRTTLPVIAELTTAGQQDDVQHSSSEGLPGSQTDMPPAAAGSAVGAEVSTDGAAEAATEHMSYTAAVAVAAAADAAAVSVARSTAGISTTANPGSAAGSPSTSSAVEPDAAAAAARGISSSCDTNISCTTAVNHSSMPAAAQGRISRNSSVKQLLAAFPCTPSWMPAGSSRSSSSSLSGSNCIDYRVTAAAGDGGTAAASEHGDSGSSDGCDVECYVRLASTAAGAAPAGLYAGPVLQSASAASKEAAAATEAAAAEAGGGFSDDMMLADFGVASRAAACELEDGYCFFSTDETDAVAAEMAAAIKSTSEATVAAAGNSIWLEGAAGVAAAAGKIWGIFGTELIVCCMFSVGSALCCPRVAHHHSSIVSGFRSI
jgi:hypothetical protein